MNSLPCAAKLADMLVNHAFGNRQLSARKSIVLPKPNRPSRTVEIKHCLTVRSDDVDMRRPMIGWIDHNPQPAMAEYRRHPYQF